MREVKRRLRRLAALLVMGLMTFAPLTGAEVAAAQEAVDAPAGVVEEVAVSDPLPAPDFSMAYRHVFLAFAFAWILMLVYAVWVRRGMGEMEREVERLNG